MLLKSFCGSLSLQSGVVILAFSLMHIAVVTFLSNLSLVPRLPTAVIFILVFVVVMLVTGALMVASAYREETTLCFISLALILLLIVLFIVGSAMSFYNHSSVTGIVCVEDRCPETLWWATLRYRKAEEAHEEAGTSTTNGTSTSDVTEETGEHEVTDQENPPVRRRREPKARAVPTYGSSEGTESTETTTVHVDTTTSPFTTTTEESTPTTTDEYEYLGTTELAHTDAGGGGYVIGIAFIAAIILFLINLIFFVYCALIVYSYSQELKYILNFKVG